MKYLVSNVELMNISPLPTCTDHYPCSSRKCSAKVPEGGGKGSHPSAPGSAPIVEPKLK